jgi:hypothetical protein
MNARFERSREILIEQNHVRFESTLLFQIHFRGNWKYVSWLRQDVHTKTFGTCSITSGGRYRKLT